MYKLELGNNIKVKTQYGENPTIYYVGLGYDENAELKAFVFWTEDSILNRFGFDAMHLINCIAIPPEI